MTGLERLSASDTVGYSHVISVPVDLECTTCGWPCAACLELALEVLLDLRPQAAVSEAGFMTGLERNSEVVQMAAYAPLFVHANFVKWPTNLIVIDNHR